MRFFTKLIGFFSPNQVGIQSQLDNMGKNEASGWVVRDGRAEPVESDFVFVVDGKRWPLKVSFFHRPGLKRINPNNKFGFKLNYPTIMSKDPNSHLFYLHHNQVFLIQSNEKGLQTDSGDEYQRNLAVARLVGQGKVVNFAQIPVKKPKENKRLTSGGSQGLICKPISAGLSDDDILGLKNAVVIPLHRSSTPDLVEGGISHPHMTPGFEQVRGKAKGYISVTNEDYIRHARHLMSKGGNKPKLLSGNSLFGGNIYNHFGHFISECAHRLYAYHYLTQEKGISIDNVVLLYSKKKGMTQKEHADDLRAYQLELFDYFSIPREKIRFINSNALVKKLYVPKQQSYFKIDEDISERYLDLLTIHQNNLAISELVKSYPKQLFVSRRHFKLSGSCAGEEYLERLFESVGFYVLFPESLSLKEQLTYYSHAEKIIFSEGSAIHTLELLGKLSADVFILNRRPGAQRLFNANLSPRVKTVRYFTECTILGAIRTFPNGSLRTTQAISVVSSVESLIQFVTSISLEAAQAFDFESFYQQELEDVLSYIEGSLLDANSSNQHQLKKHADIVLEAYQRHRGIPSTVSISLAS